MSHRPTTQSTMAYQQPSPAIDVYSAAARVPNFANMEALQEEMTHAVDEAWPQDALFDLSDTLMQPHFLQQDRVITFEDTYFRTSNMDWS